MRPKHNDSMELPLHIAVWSQFLLYRCNSQPTLNAFATAPNAAAFHAIRPNHDKSRVPALWTYDRFQRTFFVRHWPTPFQPAVRDREWCCSFCFSRACNLGAAATAWGWAGKGFTPTNEAAQYA